jgi:hypothetical protein
MSRRNGLHSRISAEIDKLQYFQLAGSDVSAAHVSSFLDDCGLTVSELRASVDSTVDAQMILLEAHDIVGAANAVLRLVDVDKFGDMDRLERIYMLRCKAWTCIADTDSIYHQLMGSKLISSRIAAWSKQFGAVNATYAYLVAHVEEQDVLDQIHLQVTDLKPKMELASYLASHALRPRHWKWMAERAFALCHIQLKFSGRSSEFVSVVDISGKELIGLGNINRLNISELVDR